MAIGIVVVEFVLELAEAGGDAESGDEFFRSGVEAAFRSFAPFAVEAEEQLIAELSGFREVGLDGGAFFRGQFGWRQRDAGIGRQRDFAAGMAIFKSGLGAVTGVGAKENAGEGVVIALRNRIEFMIVATRASDRESEDGLRDGVDLLVGEIERELARIAFVEIERAERQEAGGDELLRAFAIVLRRKQIAGDLFADELIVRLVGVQRPDHVIAIAPGVWHGGVHVAPGALRVAGDVEPMAGPGFAEARGSEEAGDDVIDGFFRGGGRQGDNGTVRQ